MRVLAFPAYSNKKTNPYQWLLYTNLGKNFVTEFSYKKALTQNFDIFHIHWPDLYIKADSLLLKFRRMVLLGGVVMWMRLRGIKIVWTVHNLSPHDADHPALTNCFMRWFVSRCDALIFLSRSSESAFDQAYTAPPHCHKAVIPHGHYRDVYPAPNSRQEARNILALPQDKKIILFFGMIKPYKNVESLIENFISLQDEDSFLLVAGSASVDMKNTLEEAASHHPNVRIIVKFIPDEMVSNLLAASDLVVLPFKNILNSGSLILSLSFNRPVVAPAIGSLIELQDIAGMDWVRLYEGDFNKGILQQEINSLKKDEKEFEAVCNLDDLAWNRIGADTLAFYRSLLS